MSPPPRAPAAGRTADGRRRPARGGPVVRRAGDRAGGDRTGPVALRRGGRGGARAGACGSGRPRLPRHRDRGGGRRGDGLVGRLRLREPGAPRPDVAGGEVPRRQHLEVADRGGGGKAGRGRPPRPGRTDPEIRSVVSGEGASHHHAADRRPPGRDPALPGQRELHPRPVPDGARRPVHLRRRPAAARAGHGVRLHELRLQPAERRGRGGRGEAVPGHHARGGLRSAGHARHRCRLRHSHHPRADQLLRAERRRQRGERAVGEQQLQVGGRRLSLDHRGRAGVRRRASRRTTSCPSRPERCSSPSRRPATAKGSDTASAGSSGRARTGGACCPTPAAPSAAPR